MTLQRCIWLIDDEPFANRVLTCQLHQLGEDRVRAFDQPQLAMECLAQEADQVELLFLDLHMPQMDGIECIRELGRLGFQGQLVLVSGEDERMLRAAQRLAEHHLGLRIGVIEKPASVRGLRQLLASLARPADAVPERSMFEAVSPEDLRAAIEAGRLENFYEPIVRFSDYAVLGVESLVRWRLADGSLIMPDRFVPVAEECGLIDALTRQVLAQALDAARRWQESGLELQVSVNVSMGSLVRLELPDVIVDMAAACGVNPNRLTLELTERQIMENPTMALDILARLRLKGVRLAIDDFGTGHSSLAQLRDVPFDQLKIDRSFVHEMSSFRSRRAIVEASVALSAELGMCTVAEGIETRQDWADALEAGCDLAQGYWIGRAMTTDDLREWFTNWPQRLQWSSA